MKNEFIPYEQALELKELGFDESCIFSYTPHKFLYNNLSKIQVHGSDSIDLQRNTSFVSAPLYQQAFRWFREKYRLYGKPEYFLNDWYCFIINDMKEEDNSRRLFTEFPSYEEAELECLKKLIEIVKKK